MRELPAGTFEIVDVPLTCRGQMLFIPYNDGDLDKPVTVTEQTTIMPTFFSACALLVYFVTSEYI
jgi:hypothetical protein